MDQPRHGTVYRGVEAGGSSDVEGRLHELVDEHLLLRDVASEDRDLVPQQLPRVLLLGHEPGDVALASPLPPLLLRHAPGFVGGRTLIPFLTRALLRLRL
eukprot:762433-Hanusia_phi.AAC.10